MTSKTEPRWQTSVEEAVEVNQRALIDKVLARYPGDFSVFRELLQNSDDAESKVVEIHLEAQGGDQAFISPSGMMKRHPEILINYCTLRNDGNLFGEEDWARLKNIAEGNPDEQKIGAFGVGFYSVFSVTDEPLVTSGGKCMGFYWKDGKDQLFVRHGTVPREIGSKWTTFQMPLRDQPAMKGPLDLVQFLSSSIAFTTCVQTISLFLNEKLVANLVKSVHHPQAMSVLSGLSNHTKRKLMSVKGVSIIPVHIRADLLDWVYLSKADGNEPLEVGNTRSDASINLCMFSAEVSVNFKAIPRLLEELQRCTKKSPPSHMRCDLLYTGPAEYKVSQKEVQTTTPGAVFEGLRPDLKGEGTARVIIGHATSQTTGFGGHIAARFIPTVERESIDFSGIYATVWNKALLEIGGILSRAAYEHELAQIKQRWDSVAQDFALTSTTEDIRNPLFEHALHALKFFTFHQSTPRKFFSKGISEAFFACLPTFPVMSSQGVKPSYDVCLPEPLLASFLKTLPVLPDAIASEAADMVEVLKGRSLINYPVMVDTIIEHLSCCPLGDDEVVACIQWWINRVKELQSTPEYDQAKHRLSQDRFLTAATFKGHYAHDDTGTSLLTIQHFVSEDSIIPKDSPFPQIVIPPTISRQFAPEDLISILRWTDLGIEPWVVHLTSESASGKSQAENFDLSRSASWAARVLGVVSRTWQNLTAPCRKSIRLALGSTTCIPTSVGMKKPKEAYLSNVVSLSDLPIADLPPESRMDELLLYLGLKRHVELELILNRLYETKGWTTVKLVQYLASVRDTLTEVDLVRLRGLDVFPSAPGTRPSHSARYSMDRLHEPSQLSRKLGLPLLDWGSETWDPLSDEAALLREVGLQSHPDLRALIQGCASEELETRNLSIQHLISNISRAYSHYDPDNFAGVPFLPSVVRGTPTLGSPHDVCIQRRWEEWGFHVLDAAYLAHASALKVKEHPSPGQLIAFLRDCPPQCNTQATRVFSLVFSLINDFSEEQRSILSTIPFVPANNILPGNQSLIHVAPSACFLLPVAHPQAFYSRIFPYVSFGDTANMFLSCCGTRERPTADAVGNALANDPVQFLDLCGGQEQYLHELRNLAANSDQISKKTLLFLRGSKCLLASGKDSRAPPPERLILRIQPPEYSLNKACHIVIADDIVSYRLFADDLVTAPQEDALENFYLSLGARRLSHLVQKMYDSSDAVDPFPEAIRLRTLVLERLPLFIHEVAPSRSKVSIHFFSNPTNFKVRAYRKLQVTKYLLNDPRAKKVTGRSAMASFVGKPLELWISTEVPVDLYEVALSITNLILDFPKNNDALLFSVFLATDLEVLEKRGYNVNKFLQQQKRFVEEPTELEFPPLINPNKFNFQTALDSATNREIPRPTPKGSPITTRETLVLEKEKSTAGSDLRSKRSTKTTIQKLQDRIHSFYQNIVPLAASTRNVDAPSLPAIDDHQSRVTIRGDLISSNISRAIQSCGANSGEQIKIQRVERIRDEETYCGAANRQNKPLHFLFQMGNMRVFMTQNVAPFPLPSESYSHDVIERNGQALARFIRILQPLATIFQLPEGSIQVLLDPDDGLVALNRNGNLFMNFRHYEVYHDEEVQTGQNRAVLISWFFAVAHEIAHNIIVGEHNSEHEFYFSRICETYLVSLFRMLSGSPHAWGE